MQYVGFKLDRGLKLFDFKLPEVDFRQMPASFACHLWRLRSCLSFNSFGTYRRAPSKVANFRSI